jgi:hypothetical protein
MLAVARYLQSQTDPVDAAAINVAVFHRIGHRQILADTLSRMVQHGLITFDYAGGFLLTGDGLAYVNEHRGDK